MSIRTRVNGTTNALSILLGAAILMGLVACADSAEQRIETVRSQVRNLLRLETYEHVYRDVVYVGEERSFLGIRTMDRQVLFAIDIVVRAGMDFSNGFEILPDETDPNRVFVELPPPEILSIDADERTIKEYFVRERGGTVGFLEYGDEIEQAKLAIEADAIERGILVGASENAAAIVRNLLELAGFGDVRVEFSGQEAIRG